MNILTVSRFALLLFSVSATAQPADQLLEVTNRYRQHWSAKGVIYGKLYHSIDGRIYQQHVYYRQPDAIAGTVTFNGKSVAVLLQFDLLRQRIVVSYMGGSRVELETKNALLFTIKDERFLYHPRGQFNPPGYYKVLFDGSPIRVFALHSKSANKQVFNETGYQGEFEVIEEKVNYYIQINQTNIYPLTSKRALVQQLQTFNLSMGPFTEDQAGLWESDKIGTVIKMAKWLQLNTDQK